MTGMRLPEPLFSALAISVLLLVMATIGASTASGRRLRAAEVRIRIRMWWYIVGGFAIALFLDRWVAVVALGLVSFVAFKEFLTLAPTRRADAKVLLWAYLTIPVQYSLAGGGHYGLFNVFIPVYVFLLLPIRMVLVGEPQGFLRSVGVIQWGLMTTVFCVSHLAFIVALPDLEGHRLSGPGLLFFLIVLTQLNDSAHFFFGRQFGRHPILTRVRPGLSIEGFVGATTLTALAAIPMAPLFTPFGASEAFVAGLGIGALGFAGFIATAAVERDLGVSETGHFVPGRGGLLERLDSLMFSAPLFFQFTYQLFYR
jgi:phosphatidate cytidylyltransferase